jgi:hypothetical protein
VKTVPEVCAACGSKFDEHSMFWGTWWLAQGITWSAVCYTCACKMKGKAAVDERERIAREERKVK